MTADTEPPARSGGPPLGYRWRQWRRRRRLRRELGREPSFGDMFADMLGTRVDAPEFQRAMSAAVYEVTGEEW